MNKPIHILRYGTVAEKVHLEKAINSYDCLSINGNTAAYVSSAIAKFIVDKFFSKPDKGFFIDPITYAFQNEIKLLSSKSKTSKDGSIKKSVSKLIEKYGFPANKVLQGKPIVATDFDESETKYDFCHRILMFQYDLVYEHIEKNDLEKYIKYAVPNAEKSIPQFRPKFLIAPYFYLDPQDSSFKKWLDINVELANLAVVQSKEYCGDTDVFSQIVMSKTVLSDSSLIKEIANAYKNTNCKGFTIWIDDFNEHEATHEELQGFIELLKLLNNKPIYNMYGGYFSILITNKAVNLLSGVSHGLEYGESRKVYPVGGGIPVSKYYFYPLHQRLDFTKAYYLLEYMGVIDTSKENWGDAERYKKEICWCGQCKDVIGNDMINFVEFESKEFYEIHRKDQVLRRKKASSDTKQNCLYHYLLCKKMEFSKANKESLESLIDDMYNQVQKYNSCESLIEGELDYLLKWVEVLKNE